jgi:hypothetical protein
MMSGRSIPSEKPSAQRKYAQYPAPSGANVLGSGTAAGVMAANNPCVSTSIPSAI